MNFLFKIVLASALCSVAFTYTWFNYGGTRIANEKEKEVIATQIHAEMMRKFDTTRDYKREVDSLMYCSDNLAYISDECVKRFLAKDLSASYAEDYNKILYEIQSESIKFVRKRGFQPEDFKDVKINAKGFNVKSLE